ncbi:MAG: hypothetical protein WA829_05690 [Candidatus Acidiferrum sp.]
MKKKSELKNFKDAMKQILTVSHEELERREDKWKKEKEEKKKKRAKV